MWKYDFIRIWLYNVGHLWTSLFMSEKKSEKRIFSNDGNPQSKFAFFWKRLVWIKTRENHNESSLIKICELQEQWWCFYVIVCFLNICSFGKSCENQTKNELREQNDICHCVPFEQSTGYTFCNEWMKRWKSSAISFWCNHISYNISPIQVGLSDLCSPQKSF